MLSQYEWVIPSRADEVDYVGRKYRFSIRDRRFQTDHHLTLAEIITISTDIKKYWM